MKLVAYQVQDINGVLNYLQERPYKEVKTLINILSAGRVVTVDEPKKEEPLKEQGKESQKETTEKRPKK